MNVFRLIKTKVLLTALYFIILPASVHAFSVSPPITELEANPGETLRADIRIQNTSEVNKVYAFTIQKFIPKGESGQQEFLPPTETDGFPEWIYFDRAAVELEAGQSVNLPIVIRVPETAEPGGYYAAVLFSEHADLSTGSVGIVPRTGSLFFLTVHGNLVKSVSIDSFQASPGASSHLPVDFSVRLANDGNVHVQPEGEVRVRNMFGNTVASYPLNPTGGRILPASHRSYQVTWTKQAAGPKHLFSGFAEEWRNFGFGKYTAEVMASVDGEPQHAQAVVWIWPWRTMALFTLIILVSAGAYFVRRMMRR